MQGGVGVSLLCSVRFLWANCRINSKVNIYLTRMPRQHPMGGWLVKDPKNPKLHKLTFKEPSVKTHGHSARTDLHRTGPGGWAGHFFHVPGHPRTDPNPGHFQYRLDVDTTRPPRNAGKDSNTRV